MTNDGHAPGCTSFMSGGFSSDISKPPNARRRWQCAADCPIAHPELMAAAVVADVESATKSLLPKLAARKDQLEAAREVRKEELVAALTESAGNITYAAKALGLHRQWVTTLVRQLGLQELARGLRRATGATGTGRPRSTKTYHSKRK